MSKLKNKYGHIQYKYHCNKCAKGYSYELSFEEWQDGEFACPKCLNKLKFVTSQDIRQGNNINYISAEKGSEQNIKRIGQEKMNEMIENDPVMKYKKESAKAAEKIWWRKGLKDPSKPLDLSKVKDTQKYIDTGDST